MKNIIIRTPNFIGDTVNTTPALELLKQEYPDAEFTLLGPGFIHDLFKHDPRITRFVTFQRGRRNHWELLKKIRKQRYDLGVLFVNTFISALLFRLAPIRTVIGYTNECRGFLLDFTLPLNRNVHYINRYASLINRFLNKKYTYLPPLTLIYSQQPPFRFTNEGKIVGFYPGGIHKGFRHYPENYALELLQRLSSYNVLLIGDARDNISHREYEKKAGHPHLMNISGRTTVEELVNTIANLDLLITIDSAAMHIAAATHTPFIALLGLSTSPTSCILPKVNFGKILKIENNLICEEDFIQNITPDLIMEQVKKMLDGPTPRDRKENNGLSNAFLSA